MLISIYVGVFSAEIFADIPLLPGYECPGWYADQYTGNWAESEQSSAGSPAHAACPSPPRRSGRDILYKRDKARSHRWTGTTGPASA